MNLIGWKIINNANQVYCERCGFRVTRINEMANKKHDNEDWCRVLKLTGGRVLKKTKESQGKTKLVKLERAPKKKSRIHEHKIASFASPRPTLGRTVFGAASKLRRICIKCKTNIVKSRGLCKECSRSQKKEL